MTRLRSLATVLLSLVAVFAPAGSPAFAQKIALRWKYEQGSELVYRATNHQEIDMAAMGGTAVSEQIQTVRWRVVEVAPNGDATIRMTTERVQIDVQGMAGNVKYDSESGEAPADPQTRALAAMAGVSYTMGVGPDGSGKAMQGLDELREKMFASFPPEQVAMLQSMGGELFSDESMTRMAQQSVQLFPEEPVGPSDTWKSSFRTSIPMIGSMTTNMTFTVMGIERRDGRTVAKISAAGELEFGNDSATPLPMTFDLGATKINGSIDFDADRGVTLASTVSTAMQMEVTAGGQQVAMGMTNRVSLELIEYVSGR